MKKKFSWYVVLAFVVLILSLMFGFNDVPAATVTMTRTWTAPGDDGNVGTAAAYVIRYTTDTLAPWVDWMDAPTPPAPQPAGTPESFTFAVDLEVGVNYWFAIKAVDDAGNWSGLSNLLCLSIPDDVPPNTIVDFK